MHLKTTKSNDTYTNSNLFIMKNFTSFHKHLNNRCYVSKKQLLSLITLLMVATGYAQSVGDSFFSNSITYQITSLSPNQVKTVGYVISGGPVVNIPSSVTNGGNTYAVTNIGTQTFASKSLTSVTIANSITTIEDLAFTNNALTTITIPNSVMTIGYAAFGVNSITSVVIPNSVTSLGDSGFDNNALTSVTISTGLTNIGVATFANNNLSSITIPANITSISANVFSNNPLSSVISEATTPPVIGSGINDPFGNRSSIDLFIPNGTTGAYVTNPGALWTGFNSVTESTLSTSDFELANKIKVITKNDSLEIKFTNNIVFKNYTIYSITGAKITSGKESFISTETLSNGIYILELQFNQGHLTKKFMR